jgi:hypothetical protein
MYIQSSDFYRVHFYFSPVTLCPCFISLQQRFPNCYTLRPPPQDFALIYAPPPQEKHKILYMEHK